MAASLLQQHDEYPLAHCRIIIISEMQVGDIAHLTCLLADGIGVQGVYLYMKGAVMMRYLDTAWTQAVTTWGASLTAGECVGLAVSMTSRVDIHLTRKFNNPSAWVAT